MTIPELRELYQTQQLVEAIIEPCLLITSLVNQET